MVERVVVALPDVVALVDLGMVDVVAHVYAVEHVGQLGVVMVRNYAKG